MGIAITITAAPTQLLISLTSWNSGERLMKKETRTRKNWRGSGNWRSLSDVGLSFTC
jgi:hypothetical protein